MTDGAKDVPVKTHISGYREINIPVVVTLQGTSAKDIPVKVTLQGDGVKDVPVAATLETYRVDYGLYGESIYETAPRETIFYAQGGTPDKSVAATDPYWFIKSGASETGKEGFMEIGFGQNDAHNQSDANLTGFIRVQLDSTSGEGEIKVKPVIWFYPSAEPTTDQEGMIYYDSTAQEFKFYNGSTWGSIGGGGGPGSGTQWTLPVWNTTTTLGDSMISQDSGGTLATVGGALALSGAISGATDITLSGVLQFAAMQIRSGADYIHIFPTIGNEVGKLCIMPSGTEDEAHLRVRNDVSSNWGAVFLSIDGTIASISSDQSGTGTAPTTLNINDPDWDVINIGDASCVTTVGGDLAVSGTGTSTFAGKVQINETGAGPFLSIGASADTTDPIQLLRFNTERAWTFRKRSTVATTRLALEADEDGKQFWIGYDDGVMYAAKFIVQDAQADCSVVLAHNVTVDGNLDVDGGTIEVASTFEMAYNSTSDSLDFNYIG